MTRAMVPSSRARWRADQSLEDAAEHLEWQVTRSLSGHGVPAQSRSVSGSSVGSGSLTVPAAGAIPWPASPGDPAPGDPVDIDVTHDLEALADQAPIGWRAACRMQARTVSWDSWLSPWRTISMEDRVPRGPVDVPIDVGRAALDACSIIDRAARAAGYYSTPRATPAAGVVQSIPLVGSLWAETGLDYMPSISDGARYTTRDGTAMLTDSMIGPSGIDYEGTGPAAEGGPGTAGVAFTADLGSPAGSGWRATVQLYLLSTIGGARIEVGYNNSEAQVRIIGMGLPITIPIPEHVPTEGCHRYVVTYDAAGPSVWTGRWWVYMDGTTVVGWGDSTASTGRAGGIYGLQIAATTDGAVGGVMLGTSLDPMDYGLLGTETALIGSADSPLESIIEPTSGDAWAIIQEVSAATLGATWIDEAGRLIYRGREALRAATPVATVRALDWLEDISGSISLDGVADRVEVTYRPPIVATSMTYSLPVMESTDVVRIAANSVATVTFDLDVATTTTGGTWRPVEDTSAPADQWSRYAAWTAPPGESGSAPAASALVVTGDLLTPTRLRVTIRNRTSSPLWVYQLTARSTLTIAAGAPITITSGADERDALNPLPPVDLGAWVQSHEAARSILQWLASETSEPRPVLADIRVIPDTDLRQGDTILLRIDSMTGDPAHTLALKALITGTSLSMRPGELEQRLTLTALAPTVDDVSRALAGLTVAQVSARFAGMTVGEVSALVARGGLL